MQGVSVTPVAVDGKGNSCLGNKESVWAGSDPKTWDNSTLCAWLATTKFAEYGEQFQKHKISGRHVLHLDCDKLASIGVEPLGDQLDLAETMQVLVSTWASNKTPVPNVFAAFFFSFGWPNFTQAEKSASKDPFTRKQEFVEELNNISLVAALLITLALPMAMSAVAEPHYGLRGAPLGVFACATFISACCFSFSLILSVVLALFVGQLSNASEIDSFFELIGDTKQVPIRLTTFSCYSLFVSLFAFICWNDKLGFIPLSDLHPFGLVACAPYLLFFPWAYWLAKGNQSMHRAKRLAWDLHAAKVERG
uniref:SAM domain-containing protein n=1 Tax=Hemiselmis andersenii TaxID=464988 RepID=A0A6U4QCM0_HEMAN